MKVKALASAIVAAVVLASLGDGGAGQTCPATTFRAREHGWYLSCTANTATKGRCTSGRNQDCPRPFSSSKDSHVNTCKCILTGHALPWKMAGYGKWLACDPDQVVVGVCSGGQKGDCRFNNQGWHQLIRCAPAQWARATQHKVTRCCDYGKDCQCPDGYFVTDSCASGSDADCENSFCANHQGNVYTGLRCTKFECLPGAAGVNGNCHPCPTGHYSSTFGKTTCDRCGPGTFQNGVGKTSCIQCPPGNHHATGGGAFCYGCEPGWFQPSPGQAGCMQCQAGTFSSRRQSKSCTPCAAGTYSTLGSRSCSPCRAGSAAKPDKSGCQDVNECLGQHGCPRFSTCTNKNVLAPPYKTYQCTCEPGYEVKGSSGAQEGGTNIECVPVKGVVMVVSRGSTWIRFRLTNVRIFTGMTAVDVHVGEWESRTRHFPIAGSPFLGVKLTSLGSHNGYMVTNLDPGTRYAFNLAAVDGPATIGGVSATTLCGCNQDQDAPSSLTATQKRGRVTFRFADESRCEDAFAFSRYHGGASNAEVFTSNYYYAAKDECDEILEPALQAADDLLTSRLEVGTVARYCVRAVGNGNSGVPYSSNETCVDHKVSWEASIDGKVTLPQESGSLPVRSVLVAWELIAPNGRVASSGEIITGASGQYRIVLNTAYNGMNSFSEYEVRIKYSKSTNGKAHVFSCDNGKADCTSGTSYTSVYLKHLEFDVEHRAVDDTSVPVIGKALIGLGDAKAICPMIGVHVCLILHNLREGDANRVCVDTSSDGTFAIPAVPGTSVTLEADYFNHTFRLEHDTLNRADVEQIEIAAESRYEGFVFRDIHDALLKVDVVGGLCDRRLGAANIQVKLPSCPDWEGMSLKQTGTRGWHKVPAHDLQVHVAVDGRPDIQFEPKGIDLRETEPNEQQGQTKAPARVDDQLSEQATATLDAQEERVTHKRDNQMSGLRFQYDGVVVVRATLAGDVADSSCVNRQDKPGESSSFHILNAYRPFLATFHAVQNFGKNIETCDHFRDGTFVHIDNNVGLGNSPSDGDFINRMAAAGRGISADAMAEYQRCRGQPDTDSDVCELPSCCRIPLRHDDAGDGKLSNARVQVLLRAGPPNIQASNSKEPDFVKYLVAEVGGTRHESQVLVVGDYDDGAPQTFPLPAMGPAMIIRDPPGGGSHTIYENVRTTTKVHLANVERKATIHQDLVSAVVIGADVDQCIGAGGGLVGPFFSTCIKSADVDQFVGARQESDVAVDDKFESDEFTTSFTTTWSYTTSTDPGIAGQPSDVFVVPIINLLLHDVIEISVSSNNKCKGAKATKYKFDTESDPENAFAFLSYGDMIWSELPRMEASKEALDKQKEDPKLRADHRAAAKVAFLQVTDAIRSWNKIFKEYMEDATNKDRQLIKPSEWFEKQVRPQASNGFKDKPGVGLPEAHWASLLPYDLADDVDPIEDWKDTNLISFSGSGTELAFTLQKEKGTDFEHMYGGAGSNVGSSFNIGAFAEGVVKVLGHGAKFELGLDPGVETSSVHHAHDISGDDTSVTFVLSDPDVGDKFDVKVWIDPKYGSFVFQTVSGLSKCIWEPNTERRESPTMSILERPSGQILPDQPAIFKIKLGNIGTSDTTFLLAADHADNDGDMRIEVNGDTLAVPQAYDFMMPEEEFITTVAIYRGPGQFSFPPVKLILRSECEYVRDPSAYVEIELYTHTKEEDGKQVKTIQFAEPCPEVQLAGPLSKTLTAVVNSGDKTSSGNHVLPIITRNMAKDVLGKWKALVESDHHRLEGVKMLYRERGTRPWSAVRVEDSKGVMQDADFSVDGVEDDYGFGRIDWDISKSQIPDGDYEIVVQTECDSINGAPSGFNSFKSDILDLVLDRRGPRAFGVHESLTMLPGDPVHFEFDEPVECEQPYRFTLGASVVGLNRDFSPDNLVVVCEKRKISFSFDPNTQRLDELIGRTFVATLKDVTDVAGNPMKSGVELKASFTHIDLAAAGSSFYVTLALKDCASARKSDIKTHVEEQILNIVQNVDPSRVAVRDTECVGDDQVKAKVVVRSSGDAGGASTGTDNASGAATTKKDKGKGKGNGGGLLQMFQEPTSHDVFHDLRQAMPEATFDSFQLSNVGELTSSDDSHNAQPTQHQVMQLTRLVQEINQSQDLHEVVHKLQDAEERFAALGVVAALALLLCVLLSFALVVILLRRQGPLPSALAKPGTPHHDADLDRPMRNV